MEVGLSLRLIMTIAGELIALLADHPSLRYNERTAPQDMDGVHALGPVFKRRAEDVD